MSRLGSIEMPPCAITLKGGQVIELVEWTNWNGQPWQTTTISRNPNGTFRCSTGEPEHGGGPDSVGTLEVALARFHPTIAHKYREIFTLSDLTEESSHECLQRYVLRNAE